MATYQVVRAAGKGDLPPLFRGVLRCEQCAAALAEVQGAVPLTGIPARLVVILWPEVEDATRRHEAGCAPPAPASGPRLGMLGWYYDRGGRRLGPFSGQEIRRQVGARELPRGHPIYVGWIKEGEMRFVETDLRYALGEPEAPPAAAASTLADRAARSTEHGPDRRGHPRQSAGYRITYSADGDARPPRSARVVDMAPGGVGLVVDRPFRAGAALTLCFSGQGEATCLLATVRVVRADPTPDGRWLLGCRFAAELNAGEFAEVVGRGTHHAAADRPLSH